MQPLHIIPSCKNLVLPCLLLALVLGCGEPADPYGRVAGAVTFQGRPVPNAVLLFESQETELAVTAEADPQGRYEARRSAEMPGLPPGTYRVAITPPMFYPGIGVMNGPKAPPKRSDIPTRFRDTATSKLTVTVTDAGATDFDIDMKP